MDTVTVDVLRVLDRNYTRYELLDGHPRIHTPIFDKLAAERFGRDE